MCLAITTPGKRKGLKASPKDSILFLNGRNRDFGEKMSSDNLSK
jgi:hypothetical protein